MGLCQQPLIMTNAVIDIGTNTVLLLIARLKSKHQLEVIHQESAVPRLGQGLSENHCLDATPMERTLDVLKKYKDICYQHKVKKIITVGTAACRIAANTKVFIDKVKKECGFKLEVISADKEAEYTFHSAWEDFGLRNKLLVIDIGGGSTEVITGPLAPKNPTPTTLISLPMGSVRLTEEYVRRDPISEEELRRLHVAVRNGVCDELDEFYPKDFNPSEYTMVATAGTATTLSAIDKKLDSLSKKIHGATLQKETLKKIIQELVNKNIKQRQAMAGMEPLRADVLLAGALLLNELMRFFKQKQTLVSQHGLRFGVFYKKFGK